MFQRWDRNKRHGPNTAIDDEFAENFDIRRMANLIGKPLLTYLTYRNTAAPRPTPRGSVPEDFARITDKHGNIHRPRKNDTDRLRGFQQDCFICRQYTDKQKNTQWKCAKCGMPLHNNDQGRELTCLQEHLQSCDPYLGCGLMQRSRWSLPNHLRKYRVADDQCQPVSKASAPRELTPSPPKRKRKRGDKSSEAATRKSPRLTRHRSGR